MGCAASSLAAYTTPVQTANGGLAQLSRGLYDLFPEVSKCTIFRADAKRLNMMVTDIIANGQLLPSSYVPRTELFDRTGVPGCTKLLVVADLDHHSLLQAGDRSALAVPLSVTEPCGCLLLSSRKSNYFSPKHEAQVRQLLQPLLKFYASHPEPEPGNLRRVSMARTSMLPGEPPAKKPRAKGTLGGLSE